MPTRQELVLQFMLALASNSNCESSEEAYKRACLLADKYLSSL